MEKPLKSVLKQFYDHAADLAKSGALKDAKPLLIRLVSNSEMSKVWQALADKTDDPQKLIDLLGFIRLHPALIGETNAPITISSDATQCSRI